MAMNSVDTPTIHSLHYFLRCDFFLSSSFFIPRLISAAVDWMSTILLHMAWP